MMHTSAMVPLYGTAGTSGAFSQRIEGTLVGQEHAPTETSRPLSTGPDTCGRLQSFGAARPLLRLSFGFGAHGARPHMHSTFTVGGPHRHAACDGLHVFLVLGQYLRIVVIMRLRILAAIAIDNGHLQLHQPAKPHRHKQRPVTHHHGRGPCECIFFWRSIATQIPQKGLLSPSSFGFTPQSCGCGADRPSHHPG